ncbi:hypothetical protein HFP15_01620 [Amycolatopsis sp. K13G38]|uniref:EthD family reductase n=1 Tax=Amycolatopsis acididurans TaxID=2724524 RepID=A0ABX1IVR8_9PSEU|nr:DUF4286 family protein [Amycolatopsis acididurans]NKQ51574.1 hypothetical protein [Amycolatopsis acididurans]
MPKAVMAVYSNPATPEQDEEYNTWYNEVHLKELLSLPGVSSGTRYRVTEAVHGAASEHRYVAVYDVDGTPEEILAQMGTLPAPSPAIDAAGARIYFWEPIEGGSA